MTYSKLVFIVLAVLYGIIWAFAQPWYNALLAGGSIHGFLAPTFLGLYGFLWINQRAITQKSSVVQLLWQGAVAGLICGFIGYSSLVVAKPQMLTDLMVQMAQIGIYAVFLLGLFQLVLGGWMIGATAYYTTGRTWRLLVKK